MAARSWSLEQRAQQAAAIRNWSPWESSTGPNTPRGKAVVARNADKDGQRQQVRAESKRVNEILRRHRDMLVEVTP